MNNRVGPYVVGDEFFGREPELEQLRALLQQGDHVSLVAQRRTGKTSLLRETARRASGLHCLYVDLQGSRDAADAIVEMVLASKAHVSLWNRVQSIFQNVLGAVESVGAAELQIQLRSGLVGDWRPKGDRLLADLAAADLPVVLMLDELPVLLVRMLRDDDGRPRAGGREAADGFLTWLRKGALAHPRLRVVVTGSIGLGPVAHKAGLSGALNIYRPLALEPWLPATAMEALDRLAGHAHLAFEDDAREQVIALLGSCIPYHVQLFFSQLHEDARRVGRTTVRKEDVDRVYVSRMLTSHSHAELAHMEERLKLMVAPEILALTLDLLTEAAVVQGGLGTDAARRIARDHVVQAASIPENLRDVFAVLEHDGYLALGPDGRRRFVSSLLRDWWKARFGEFHVAAAARTTP